MKLKNLLFFLVMLSLIINISKCFAITAKESTDAGYVYGEGYSKEMVRLINIRKKQVHGQDSEEKSIVKQYIKKQLREPDLTVTSDDFGHARDTFK